MRLLLLWRMSSKIPGNSDTFLSHSTQALCLINEEIWRLKEEEGKNIQVWHQTGNHLNTKISIRIRCIKSSKGIISMPIYSDSIPSIPSNTFIYPSASSEQNPGTTASHLVASQINRLCSSPFCTRKPCTKAQPGSSETRFPSFFLF